MSNFNEGDVVYVIGDGWHRPLSRSRVERVTKTQAILPDGSKYNRTTGRKVGANEYSAARIELPDAALDREHHGQKIRAAVEALEAAARRYRSVNGSSPDAIRVAYAAWDALVKESKS